MTRILLVAATNVAADPLAKALDRFPAGSVVQLAAMRWSPPEVTELPLDHLRRLSRPRGLRRALPQSAVSPRFWRQVAQSLAYRIVARVADAPMKTWYATRWDPWVRVAVEDADVLVALDRHAVYAVWQLAKRNRSAAAVYGLDAAVRAAGTAASAATASANSR